MKKIILICFILLPFILNSQIEPYNHPKYQDIKDNLIRGWNTWNNRSVTSYVLLPECLAINLAFKQQYWLELQDVGLNSLYIADCYALAKMA